MKPIKNAYIADPKKVKDVYGKLSERIGEINQSLKTLKKKK